MRNNLWNLLVRLKVDEYYFQLYTHRSKVWNTIVSVLCALSSAGCIVTWYYIGSFRYIAGAIIFLSQLLAIFQQYFPYAKRLSAARYIYSDISKLNVDAYIDFIKMFEDTPDNEIIPVIAQIEGRYLEISQKYATPDLFPFNNRLLKKAEAYAKIYMEGLI